MVDIKSSPKRGIHSITIMPQETRKISNKQYNFTLKGTWKRTTNKTKMCRGKEIIKIRGEINKIESKKATTKD